MTVTTSYLVLYSYCWIGVSRAPETWEVRHEALLGLSSVTSAEAAHDIADAYLDAAVDYSLQVTWAPDYTSNPFGVLGSTLLVDDYNDTQQRERVVSLTVAEDDDGFLSFGMDLRNVRLSAFERWQRALEKVAAGTLDGKSQLARPVTWAEPT